MSATRERSRCRVAEEALRYLEVVDLFASLGVDPHAGARGRAAHARAREDRTRDAGAATRKAVLRWRS